MASILTNNGAMVALQTMRSLNKGMETTQSQIATGLKVGSAKDNAAVWSIAKTMESDVAGFSGIKNNLSQASATVAVALTGGEQIVELMKDMRELVASGLSENVDHAKIQQDIEGKQAQITSIINASQFNGANLLKTEIDGTATTLTVAMSLDRTGATDPELATLDVATADLEDTLDWAGGAMTEMTDATTAATALEDLDGLIADVTTAVSQLGTDAKRIDDQLNFVNNFMDVMKSGIGALVDADMEEASARLQALQVQQQLGIQALSIANQQPQNILSLFR